MRYSSIRNAALDVSRICLGCMSFGTPGVGPQKWAVDEEASREFTRRALEKGITFFDTANVYSNGRSEEILGRALRDMARREDIVLATKVGLPMGAAPDDRGLSRAAIHKAIDQSLSRLGTDYVDLYVIHRPDPNTPVAETLEALDEVVKAGKVRHLGASTMLAWEFARMMDMQATNGWAPFVSMQNYYNLIYREEEREMVPLCLADDIALTPWSPLARGKLARPPGLATARTEGDHFANKLLAQTELEDASILDAVAAAAKARGVPMAQLALAWLLHKPAVVAPVVGVTSLAQLDDACAAAELELDDAELAALDSADRPHGLAEMTYDVTRVHPTPTAPRHSEKPR